MDKGNYKKDKEGRIIKVGTIVWTIDPDGEKRYLLRHNKPFNGYEDEWTISFGNVEEADEEKSTVIREVKEEFGIERVEDEDIKDLKYEVGFESGRGKTAIKFYAVKVKDIDIKIRLNEESIGYDWMKFDDVTKIMKHDDEKKAFDLI